MIKLSALKKLPAPVKKILAALAILLTVFVTAVSINEAVGFSRNFPTWRSLSSLLFREVPQVSELDGNTAQVHFIDVGQGDCALICTPDCCVLIDCGEYDSFGKVDRYLTTLGIKRIDLMIMSHAHSDHMGCMYRVAEKYETGSVMMPRTDEAYIPQSGPYTRLTETINAKDIPVIFAEQGKTLNVGENAMIEVIAPVREYDDLNNGSAVIRFTYENVRFLFCGDIEKDAEQDILDSGADVSADVIKVPHHGSGTSSTRKFVNAVSPRYAVFCAGENNDFGHPHANIVTLYRNIGAQIFRTDMNGNIVFSTDGENIVTGTQKGQGSSVPVLDDAA